MSQEIEQLNRALTRMLGATEIRAVESPDGIRLEFTGLQPILAAIDALPPISTDGDFVAAVTEQMRDIKSRLQSYDCGLDMAAHFLRAAVDGTLPAGVFDQPAESPASEMMLEQPAA